MDVCVRSSVLMASWRLWQELEQWASQKDDVRDDDVDSDEALEEAEEKAAAVDVAEVVRRGVPSVSDSRRTQPGERWLAGVLGGTPPEADAAEAAFVERGVGGHTAAEHLAAAAAAAAACACAGGCCWPGLPPSRATGGAPALRGPLRL